MKEHRKNQRKKTDPKEKTPRPSAKQDRLFVIAWTNENQTNYRPRDAFFLQPTWIWNPYYGCKRIFVTRKKQWKEWLGREKIIKDRQQSERDAGLCDKQREWLSAGCPCNGRQHAYVLEKKIVCRCQNKNCQCAHPSTGRYQALKDLQ